MPQLEIADIVSVFAQLWDEIHNNNYPQSCLPYINASGIMCIILPVCSTLCFKTEHHNSYNFTHLHCMVLSRSDHPECMVWKVCVRHQPEAGESKGHWCHCASAVPGQGLQTHPHWILKGLFVSLSVCPFDYLNCAETSGFINHILSPVVWCFKHFLCKTICFIFPEEKFVSDSHT